MDIKEKIDEKRQQLSYKVQAKIKEYLHIQGIGRRTNGITEELTFRVMDVFTMSLWDEIVPLIESEIQVRLEQATSKPLPDKCPECGSEVNIRDCGNHYWWMCPTCGARMMDKYSPSSDKVREILIRHFEPVDVDEKVDFAYSLTTCVNGICGGIE